MRRLTLRKGSIPLFITCFISIFASFFANPVKADNYETYGANDFLFTFEEPQNFTVRTYAQQSGIDSMLWLYDSDNNLITANDDYYGLDSNISVDLQPGTYRLRTGVCCGDPYRWYGQSYTFETSTSLIANQEVPTTTTTTTTIQRYLNPPQNLVVDSTNETKVYLSWEPPSQSNTEVERYAIFWSCDNWASGYAISSLTTSAIVENLNPDQECLFKVRADNDSLSVYSGWSNEVSGITLPTTTTTTSTTTSSTTTTSTTTTTTTAPTTTTTVFFGPILTIPTTTTTTTLVPTTTTSTSTTTTVLPTTTSTTTTTVLATTTTTIPFVITNEITQDQAVSAATSEEVLQEVTKDEAEEIFKAIDVEEITEEQKTEIIDAVQDAPEEVKQAFEAEIDIYGDGFDDYVPVGSEIPVKSRRTLLAAMGAVSAVTVVGSSGTGSTPSGGNSNTGNGGNSNSHFKKDEEENEDEEEAPEIEGPEGGDEGDFTRNSIFKYTEEGMRKFSIWNFIKKISRETAALAFTISSTVIVFATLSGDTRKITLIATSVAFLVHYISVIIKNDEE